MFTGILTIDSNEPLESRHYCCAAAVIGSGDSDVMDCVTLNVLGKLVLKFLDAQHYQFIKKIKKISIEIKRM